MIEADKLHKLFGTFTAVREISLNVADGEVVALLGPNGAGKTTTVRMLAAILKPTSGRALIAGYDVVEQAREARHVVGLLTEYPGLYNRMRPMEYLQFFGALQGMTAIEAEQRGRLLLQQFGLWESREKRLDSYSKGHEAEGRPDPRADPRPAKYCSWMSRPPRWIRTARAPCATRSPSCARRGAPCC